MDIRWGGGAAMTMEKKNDEYVVNNSINLTSRFFSQTQSQLVIKCCCFIICSLGIDSWCFESLL